MEFRYVNEEIERDRNAVMEILREKEHHYKNILESLPIAVYTCDARGYITFYNRAAAELWGREPQTGRDQWSGSWKLYNASGERLMPDSCPMAITLKEGKAILNAEIIIERPDGVKRNVKTNPQPIFDSEGNITGAMNTLIDITEQKLTQEVLKQTEENKDNLSQSNTSLKHLNDELEQFAYIISHDLQEPVRKIHVFGDLLKEKNAGIIDKTSEKYIDKILQATDRMKVLIHEVLSYSRIANEPSRFIKTDLNEIFTSVLEDLELRIDQKKATVDCASLPVAEIIPIQITQLFYNILDNALKYTLSENRPFIRVFAKALSPEEVAAMKLDGRQNFFEITIKDNGIGFKQEYVENVFAVFQRIEDGFSVEGSGIGLAICKKIVNNHHGEIYARSIPGTGTEIHVVLPFRQ